MLMCYLILIYTTLEKIREYFKERGIKTIGGFGEWNYFWSDQSLMSEKNV